MSGLSARGSAWVWGVSRGLIDSSTPSVWVQRPRGLYPVGTTANAGQLGPQQHPTPPGRPLWMPETEGPSSSPSATS